MARARAFGIHSAMPSVQAESITILAPVASSNGPTKCLRQVFSLIPE